MVQLSSIIQQIQPSPTLAAAARAQELKAQGRDIISFTVGEPDFDTPAHVKQAALHAMEKGHTKYTAVGGIAPLRTAIVEKLKRDQKLDFKPSQICVTNGGKQALAGACSVILNPGDEVIIPAPYWTSYPDIVRLCGAKEKVVMTEGKDGYLMTPSELVAAITPRTRMLILNSPSNPTGGCYTADDFKALGQALLSSPYGKQIVVLSDEVYEPITFNGFEHVSIATAVPELLEQTVIVNAFSKAYSMTGWRVGYAAGPSRVIDAITTHQSQFTSNVCSIAQYAAAVAYSDNYAFPKMMAEEFQHRFEMVCQAVEEMPGVSLPVKPKGAFYAFLRIEGLIGRKDGETTIRCGQDFATYLLEKFDVATVQGEAFGDPNAIRISFALSREALQKGLSRIAEAATRLK